MNVGTYQLGGWVPLPVLTGTAWPLDSGGVRVVPTLSIFDANFDYVVRDEQVLPLLSKTGFHQVQRRLGPEFSVGSFVAVISWDDAGSTKAVQRVFEVTAGGHTSGAYTGLSFYDGRNSSYLVGLTDGGRIEARKGPKV